MKRKPQLFTIFFLFLLCNVKGQLLYEERFGGSLNGRLRELETEKEINTQQLKSYWHNFPFHNKKVVESREAEQKFAMFLIPLLDKNYKVDKEEVISAFLDTIVVTKTLDRFLSLAEKYLYEPNSPYYNDEVYLCFLKYEAKTDFRHLSQSARFKRHYNMIQKNMVGEPAIDFTYETQTGEKGTLYSVTAKYLVLFFNDPSCSECKQLKEELIQQQSAFDSLGVKVFAVYIDDKPEEWRQANYPTDWLNGYAPEIDSEDLYNIRALPCLYLLDKDKKVISRDTSVEKILKCIK